MKNSKVVRSCVSLVAVVLISPSFANASCPKNGCPPARQAPVRAAPQAMRAPAMQMPRQTPPIGSSRGGVAGQAISQHSPFAQGQGASVQHSPFAQSQGAQFGRSPSQQSPFATGSHSREIGPSPQQSPFAQRGVEASSSARSTGFSRGAPTAFDQGSSEPRRFGATAHASASAAVGSSSEVPSSRRFGAESGGFHSEHAEAQLGHGAPMRNAAGHAYMYNGHSYSPFRASRYAWPRGYSYRRYNVGYRLPHAFWVHQYFIEDYANYGVAPPDPGFQWVRYGPDLLLIDLSSGQVANVVPGVFDESGGDGQQDASADPSQGQDQPQ
jgi:Ni/Co efflux regulator RcnB